PLEEEGGGRRPPGEGKPARVVWAVPLTRPPSAGCPLPQGERSVFPLTLPARPKPPREPRQVACVRQNHSFPLPFWLASPLPDPLTHPSTRRREFGRSRLPLPKPFHPEGCLPTPTELRQRLTNAPTYRESLPVILRACRPDRRPGVRGRCR